MKVTLKDIAEDTGYSISTISRALNGLDKTSTKAKREILKSARKLNYPLHNKIDSATATGDLNVMLITGVEIGEFYASFFNGINNAASREKVRLSLTSLENEIPDLQEIANNIEEQSYNGLIINTPRFSTAQYRKLKEALPDDFPVISNEVLDNQIFDTVGFDNYSAGNLVAKHFEDRGYTTCGIIRGPSEKTAARLRGHGFTDYINGVEDMEILLEAEGNYSFDSGVQAFQAFEQLEEKPSAIFSANDNMCKAFMKEAMLEGYTFPDDIAIVGFDDLPMCRNHRPTISSVHTDYELLGKVSIQKMKEMLANPEDPKTLLSLVPVELNVRESS
ncbi:LacI family DNA-binding transcriptional regulator [Fodinibius halophilus]|uniref:LacI family transcriptional regulator n=1 Tax=Fodinibius halophilus TaxID=1736908 RepID=A0A6M1TFH4_9BACT|nr:LacI family transcriptional regulator [Fodinibius halophilus]